MQLPRFHPGQIFLHLSLKQKIFGIPHLIALAALLILVEMAPFVDPHAGPINDHQMDYPLRRTTVTKGYPWDTLQRGRCQWVQVVQVFQKKKAK